MAVAPSRTGALGPSRPPLPPCHASLVTYRRSGRGGLPPYQPIGLTKIFTVLLLSLGIGWVVSEASKSTGLAGLTAFIAFVVILRIVR